VSVYAGIKAQNSNTTFTQGCEILDKEPPNNTPADECGSNAGFAAAVAAATAADQVVLALGESRGQSGESASRVEIDLPAASSRSSSTRSRRPASRSSSCCSTAAR
jgi:beta-glucosidase